MKFFNQLTLSGLWTSFVSFAPFFKSLFRVFRVFGGPRSQTTAQKPPAFAPMCTYVRLRASTCAKMKNFQNSAQTAHNCTLAKTQTPNGKREPPFPELSALNGTYRHHKNVKTDW